MHPHQSGVFVQSKATQSAAVACVCIGFALAQRQPLALCWLCVRREAMQKGREQPTPIDSRAALRTRIAQSLALCSACDDGDGNSASQHNTTQASTTLAFCISHFAFVFAFDHQKQTFPRLARSRRRKRVASPRLAGRFRTSAIVNEPKQNTTVTTNSPRHLRTHIFIPLIIIMIY